MEDTRYDYTSRRIFQFQLMDVSQTPTALPAAIKANLALWLDGGNPDSMPADPPMRWLDSSGNALHVSQPNPAAAPERLEDGFDFSNRGYFEGPSPLPAMAMNFTMSAVFNPSKVDGWQTIASVGRDDRDVFATSATFYLVHKNIAFDFMWGDQKFLTQTVSARKINFGSLTISAGAAAYGSVNSLGSANGASAEAGRYPNDQLQVNNTCFAIGRICPTRLNVNPFSGSIHEVMIFTTNLPEALRFWIDGYFAWKWGVVDLLPAWHLYAAAPPVL